MAAGAVETSDNSVFLCHSSADKSAVEAVAQKLRDAGIRPWLDVWNLIPGEEFATEIEEAMRQCEAIAVFIGPTGRSPWQNHEVNRALNASVESGKRLIPVILPDTSEELAGDFLTDRTWVKFRSVDDPEALRRLICGVKGEIPGPALTPTDSPPATFDEGCPYAGLSSYDVRHWPYFFGRERATERAVEKLEATLDRGQARFLAVLGASGSGKSSLARAGIVHALLAKHPGWRYVAFEPSADPVRRMAGEIARLGLATAQNPDWSGAIPFGDWGSALIPANSRLIVLVDQFEEIFTRCADDQAREAFISHLISAASHESGKCVVLLTMRMDFYEKCARFEALAALMSDHQVVLGPMDITGLQAAIERPARKELWDFEPGLVARLISDCGDDAPLPLLEIVLKQLWKKCRATRKLTLAAYQSMTLNGAINELADEFFKPLSHEDQELTLSLFSKLAQANGGGTYVRRRLPLSEVMPVNAGEAKRLESVIGRLAGPDLRLLIMQFDRGQVLVQAAHEAVFDGWTGLHARLVKDDEFLTWRQRLEADLYAWQHDSRGGYCISGDRLKEALSYLAQRPADLTNQEKAYIADCKRRRNRRRATMTGIASLALIAAAAVVIVLLSRAHLANLLAAARSQVDRRNPLGLLLAYEASSRDSSSETEVLLQQAVQVFSEPLLEWMGDSQDDNGFTDLAISEDGRSVVVAAAGGSVLAWQAPATPRAGGPLWGPDLKQPVLLRVARPAVRTAVNSNGTVVAAATGAATGEIHVWNTAAASDAFAVQPAGAPVTALAISRDGAAIAAATEDNRIIWRRKTPRNGEPDQVSIPVPARDLAFGPDAAVLAAACDDTLVRVFQLSTGKEAAPPIRHEGVANYVAFSSAGELLASGAKLAEAKVSTAKSALKKSFQPTGGAVLSTAFSSDGRYLATLNSDDSVTVWDVGSGLPLRRFPLSERAAKIVISGDGKRIAGMVAPAVGRDGQPAPGKVRIYELDFAELRRAALSAIGLQDDIDCSGYPRAQAACEKIRKEAKAQ